MWAEADLLCVPHGPYGGVREDHCGHRVVVGFGLRHVIEQSERKKRVQIS